MPPFVDDQMHNPIPTRPVVGSGLREPFSTAIDDFLLELKGKSDPRNPFLKALVTGQRQIPVNHDNVNQSDVSAEALRSFVEDIQSQKLTDRGHRFLKRVTPFLGALHGLMKTCETLVQASPFGVSAAFTGARIVIELGTRMSAYSETVVEAMDDIKVYIQCYGKLADVYKSSSKVQAQIVESYKRIIQFWYDVSHTLSQHSLKVVLKSIWKPLEKDIKTALEGLKRDSEKVQSITSVERDGQEKEEREARQRLGITKWISSNEYVDVRIDLKQQHDRHHQGTCQWFFEEDRFREWRDSNKSEILWYTAPPGSGKSVLSSAVVDHLTRAGAKVVYFFYSFSSPHRRHGIKGLRSLALQLLAQLGRIPDKVMATYETEMRNHAVILSASLTAANVVRDLAGQCDKVYLVIDGLDECSDEQDTLQALQYLWTQSTYGVVKWLVTSRDQSNIRTTMEDQKAVEIQPRQQAIIEDIRKYFSAHIDCHSCIEQWTEDEDNFLYARLVCETLQGQGLTCKEEIGEALSKFPRGLKAYYMRTLEKLILRSEEEQELARRTFLVLTTAAQPISQNELLNVLAVRPGAKDHSPRRVPKTPSVITDICSPLVVLDAKGQGSKPGNPLVKLVHKTVQDFFRQEEDAFALDVQSKLRKFSCAMIKANQELGLDCLTYLQYERYQKKGAVNLDSLLKQPEPFFDHAFLRYAATFWSQHLDGRIASPDVDKIVRRFLQSPAFWSCLVVQAYTAPYLFGRYTAKKEGEFQMAIRTACWRGNDSFGLPIPDWLDVCSHEGLLLDRSLCQFVWDWREVLATCPEGMRLCVPLRRFDTSCHLTPLEGAKSVKAFHIEPSLGGDSIASKIRLTDVSFLGKTLWADVLRYDTGGNALALHVPLFSKKKQSIARSIPPSMEVGKADWLSFVTQPGVGSLTDLEAWTIDQNTLTAKRTTEEGSEVFETPVTVASHSTGKRKGSWGVAGRQKIASKMDDEATVLLLHMTRLPEQALFGSSLIQDVGASDSGESDVSSISGGTGKKSDDSSDDDSDDDSVVALPSNEEKAQGAVVNSDSETDMDSEPHQEKYPRSDCIVLVPKSGRPSWHPWSRPSGTVWSKVACAKHPVLPLILMTHTHRELEVIDLSTHNRHTKHLPEAVSLQEGIRASVRELCFSPCGNYLHFLSLGFVRVTDKSEVTTVHVAVSTFAFNAADSNEMLVQEGQTSRCTYTFGQSLWDVAKPLALTQWGDTYIIIALPPLTCNPKVLRISLPKGPELDLDHTSSDHVIKTLKSPIYFPTSTPQRSPRLLHRVEDNTVNKSEEVGSGEASYIYLALDAAEDSAEERLTSRLKQENQQQSPLSQEKQLEVEPNRACPPVVLRWKIPHPEGWRLWETDEDSSTSDIKRGLSQAQLLRGSFVDSNKSFSVPIRSGLNWTRKGFLSCN